MAPTPNASTPYFLTTVWAERSGGADDEARRIA